MDKLSPKEIIVLNWLKLIGEFPLEHTARMIVRELAKQDVCPDKYSISTIVDVGNDAFKAGKNHQLAKDKCPECGGKKIVPTKNILTTGWKHCPTCQNTGKK